MCSINFILDNERITCTAENPGLTLRSLSFLAGIHLIWNYYTISTRLPSCKSLRYLEMLLGRTFQNENIQVAGVSLHNFQMISFPNEHRKMRRLEVLESWEGLGYLLKTEEASTNVDIYSISMWIPQNLQNREGKLIRDKLGDFPANTPFAGNLILHAISTRKFSKNISPGTSFACWVCKVVIFSSFFSLKNLLKLCTSSCFIYRNLFLVAVGSCLIKS